MNYRIPDYYRQFKCIAGACPATCCAGWKIMIDRKSLNKYYTYSAPFGNRLQNSIDWREGSFDQYQGHCAFLNEDNLCDIYIEAGKDMLCRTCRRYPRHMEEFENEREYSLSISCPVVAELILSRQEKVRFLEKKDERKEEWEEFDFFLYSALQNCRALMFRILQDREKTAAFRIAKILAVGHDVQNRIDRRKIFDIGNVLKRYETAEADLILNKKFEILCQKIESSRNPLDELENLYQILDRFEVLDSSWTVFQKEARGQLPLLKAKKSEFDIEEDELAIEAEQLIIYFLYTYFCGAVYDREAFAKIKLAVVSLLLIRGLEKAAGTASDELPSLNERTKIVWRYARELEHSDNNLNRMEQWLMERPEADFEILIFLAEKIL